MPPTRLRKSNIHNIIFYVTPEMGLHDALYDIWDKKGIFLINKHHVTVIHKTLI